MQGRARQGRGTAEFQNHQKNAFSRPGKLKMLVWNCSKPGHGRAARAEQAGQGHSRVPKPPKNAFSRPGKLKMLVLELLKARAWQGS